ncbi:MAG: ferritin [bacterium]
MASNIEQQFNMELYSSYFYLYLSSLAENESLKGVSEWFMAKHFEEQAHAMKMYRYLKDQGVDVCLHPVEAPPSTKGMSVLQMLEATLEHECSVTKAIHNLVDKALAEKDHATNIFLQWFVTEQIEEEATVGETLGRLRLFGDKPEGLLMIDSELGAAAVEMVSAGASGPTVGN